MYRLRITTGGLAFWREASGLPLCQSARYPEYHRDRTARPGVRAARPAARGRASLDAPRPSHRRRWGRVTRLERLSAQRVERVHHWWVMHHPAGLPFCVLPGPPAMLTDHNAHRWGW